jgi:CRP/FNR family transcriptional regulator
VEIFADLEERELAEIASVAVPRTFERGEVLFREGDRGDTCYVVRSGAVVIRRDHSGGSGRSLTLAEFRAGAFFGELAMFGGEVRSATAETLEDTAVVALLSSDMQRVMRTSPDISFKMLAGLADRLRQANERLLVQSFQTVSGRVAGALLGQVVARQAEGAGDEEVLVQATQAEIAQLAGTSRESASRFLASLEREGVVDLGRGKVTVHEPGRLRNYIH